MKAQEQNLYDLFQQMLESPEQVAPQLDSSARTAKGVEEMTAMADLTDLIGERATPVINAEGALERARDRLLASMAVTPALVESPARALPVRRVIQPMQVTPSPWQGLLGILRVPAVPAWATASVAVLLVVFVTVYMGVVFSANAMPGDFLFPVKQAMEEIAIFLTFNPVRKSNALEEQNYERLREIETIIEQGKTVRVTYQGEITGRDGDYWIIGDFPVLVDGNAHWLEGLEVGELVQVSGVTAPDGVIHSGEISIPTSPLQLPPPPDSSLPGLNLDSLATDTPAPLPTKKPTLKPVYRPPVKPRATKVPRPTQAIAETATPAAPIDDTPTVEPPAGSATATPISGGTPELTPTLDVTLTQTPDETTTPSETEAPTPTPEETPAPDLTPTLDVTDTPTEPTATPSVEDTVTPPEDTPTPPPADDDTPTPPPPADDTATPVPTDSSPTNTPLPPQSTDTPEPPSPTDTPVPPQPTNTPLPPTSTSAPPRPTNTPEPPPTAAPQPTSTPAAGQS